MLARKLAAASLASATLAGCIGPLAERPYGTSVERAYECGQFYCNSAAMVRKVKVVYPGSLVHGGGFMTSVAYHGWVVSEIRQDGVELRPSRDSPESVLIPYNEQVTVELRSQPRYNFESSLLFERGPEPGTAVMTVLEKAR